MITVANMFFVFFIKLMDTTKIIPIIYLFEPVSTFESVFSINFLVSFVIFIQFKTFVFNLCIREKNGIKYANGSKVVVRKEMHINCLVVFTLLILMDVLFKQND